MDYAKLIVQKNMGFGPTFSDEIKQNILQRSPNFINIFTIMFLKYFNVTLRK